MATQFLIQANQRRVECFKYTVNRRIPPLKHKLKRFQVT